MLRRLPMSKHFQGKEYKNSHIWKGILCQRKPLKDSLPCEIQININNEFRSAKKIVSLISFPSKFAGAEWQ